MRCEIVLNSVFILGVFKTSAGLTLLKILPPIFCSVVERVDPELSGLCQTILLHWHYSSIRAFASIMILLQKFLGHISGFLTGTFFTGWNCQPNDQPPPEGSGPIFIIPGTGWPSYIPRHWVPILVAFYDMHGLQWDYSLISVTTRENRKKYVAEVGSVFMSHLQNTSIFSNI